jgi:putative MFS transporter
MDREYGVRALPKDWPAAGIAKRRRGNSNQAMEQSLTATEHDIALIGARIDRLPPSRHVWGLVVLLSLGGCFELYDLLMTGYVSPGLIRDGIFSATAGWFGLSDQAAFAAVTFAGLFLGTIGFGFVADRFGRRMVFTMSLLWYSAATLMMATRHGAIAVEAWRFVAALGIGVELVTIDTYVAELVPKHIRGRAFAVNQAIGFCSVPIVAFLSWMLVPASPFGISGWRFVAGFAAIAALIVWVIRRRVPESPRWLAQHGRLDEAERVTAAIEARVAAEHGSLPPVGMVAAERAGAASWGEIFRPPYRRRTIMLSVFNFCQAIGFYGFGNWVPALLAAQGAAFAKSLEYSFVIALASPSVFLLFQPFADRVERKWQICAAAFGTACFGLAFAWAASPVWLMVFGALITGSNNLLSYAYHTYQAELFPTRMRARAVGFVYSFSRLSTVFNSFLIAFFLGRGGAPAVFGFISAAMLVVIISIGVFGPRTAGRALEEISG